MTAGKIFIDTNILVYAHDKSAGVKNEHAVTLIKQLWQNKNGVISTQVLQELYVVLTQKVKNKLDQKSAKQIVELYSNWQIIPVQANDVLESIDLQIKYKLSFWDSLIIHMALVNDCQTIYSEDLQHGMKIKHLTIYNPF